METHFFPSSQIINGQFYVQPFPSILITHFSLSPSHRRIPQIPFHFLPTEIHLFKQESHFSQCQLRQTIQNLTNIQSNIILIQQQASFQKSFSSSFKSVSPLNSKSIIKPVALRRQSPQIQSSFSSFSSMVISPPEKKSTTTIHPPTQGKENISNITQSVRQNHNNQQAKMGISEQRRVIQYAPKSNSTTLEEQFIQELQNSLQLELSQQQSFPLMMAAAAAAMTNQASFGSQNIDANTFLQMFSSEHPQQQQPDILPFFTPFRSFSSIDTSSTVKKTENDQEEDVVSSPPLVKKRKTYRRPVAMKQCEKEDQNTPVSEVLQNNLIEKDSQITPNTLAIPARNIVEEELCQQEENQAIERIEEANCHSESSKDCSKDDDEEEGGEEGKSLQQQQEDEKPKEKKTRLCNCKKTKCLKLYCDCFAVGEFCGPDCNCCDCCNTVSNKDVRNKIVESLLEKNPFAFNVKDIEPEEVQQLSLKAQKKLASKKGCNCKRSGCLKKYCQCFQDGLQCGEHCKCNGCENCEKPAKRLFLTDQISLSLSTSTQPNTSQSSCVPISTATIISNATQNASSPLSTEYKEINSSQCDFISGFPQNYNNNNSLFDEQSQQNLLTHILANMLTQQPSLLNNQLLQLASISQNCMQPTNQIFDQNQFSLEKLLLSTSMISNDQTNNNNMNTIFNQNQD